MAKVLEVSTSMLISHQMDTLPHQLSSGRGVIVDPAVLDRFEQLGPYLEMLNRAVFIDDVELIDHIAGKLSGLLSFSSNLKAVNN